MSKVTLNEEYFTQTLPAPDPDFEQQTLQTLRQLPEPRPERISRPRLVLALSILLVLLLATALAVGITYSKRYQAVQSGRDAVQGYQGIEHLQEYALWQGDTLTLRYEPVMPEYHSLGVYTVTVRPGEAPEVAWEAYDPVAKDRAMEQAYQAIDPALNDFYHNTLPAEYKDNDLTLEQAAQRDALYREAGFDPLNYAAAIPDKQDISQEEAWAIALQALEAEYGIPADALENGGKNIYFNAYPGGQREWFFWVFPAGDFQDDIYSISLDAADGAVLYMVHDVPGHG